MPRDKSSRSAPARTRNERVPPPEAPDIPSLYQLQHSKKAALLALAEKHGINASSSDTKSTIISRLDAARAGPSTSSDPSASAGPSSSAPREARTRQASEASDTPSLREQFAALKETVHQLQRRNSELEMVPGTPPAELLRDSPPAGPPLTTSFAPLLAPPLVPSVPPLAPPLAAASTALPHPTTTLSLAAPPLPGLPSTGESSLVADVSDVQLRTIFVPNDLRESLSRGEYQIFSDWTFLALGLRPTRKIKTDGPRPPERHLSITEWLEAGFNVRRCLRSLAVDNPQHACHAEQLHEHLAHVLQSYNAGYLWNRLVDYDRAVRQFKAQNQGFDIGNPARSKDTFERLVSNPALAPLSSTPKTPSRASSSAVYPRPSTRSAANNVCFRCGSRGHLSTSCSATPRRRPPLDGPPDSQPAPADGAHSTICRAWNAGKCLRTNCSRRHQCVLCYGDHVCHLCPHITDTVSNL